MARWLFDALEGMDAATKAREGRDARPRGQPVELFVTITDFYGYARQVPISEPRLVKDHGTATG